MNQKIRRRKHEGLQSWRKGTIAGRSGIKDMAVPAKAALCLPKKFDFCALDEDVNLTEEALRNTACKTVNEKPVSSWSSMFEQVVKFLHEKDKSVLFELVHAPDEGSPFLLSCLARRMVCASAENR